MPICPKCKAPLRVQQVEESASEIIMHYACANRTCENYAQEVCAQTMEREKDKQPKA